MQLVLKFANLCFNLLCGEPDVNFISQCHVIIISLNVANDTKCLQKLKKKKSWCYFALIDYLSVILNCPLSNSTKKTNGQTIEQSQYCGSSNFL